jgi:hypothetical protein
VLAVVSLKRPARRELRLRHCAEFCRGQGDRFGVAIPTGRKKIGPAWRTIVFTLEKCGLDGAKDSRKLLLGCALSIGARPRQRRVEG